jgi:hypothetical protein
MVAAEVEAMEETLTQFRQVGTGAAMPNWAVQ